ncbi:MAG TPA: hypothetical protein PKM58_08580 [Pyrinomonadaceae bacterium]|nr:hypothetical protein [Pyrinomonadaceae bacterium]HNU07719.1 hypothetical protein [Pyrinomonadaceae bacterium]
MKYIGSTIIIVAFFSIAAAAQQLSALEIAKKTIAASGGDSWRDPRTLELSGTATLYWGDKSYRMTTYHMWRVFPGSNDNARNANGKVRFDALEGDKTFFRIAFDGKSTSQFLSDEAKAHEELLRWGNNFGFSIFRYVENEGFSVIRLPDDKIDDHPCYLIKIVDPKKGETIFGIDKKTFHIRYAAFRTPIGFHQRIYDDFKWSKNPRFIQPRSLRIFNDGVKIADVFWSEFKIDQPIADSVFVF